MTVLKSIFRIAAITSLLACAATSVPVYAADPTPEASGTSQSFVSDSAITAKAKAALISNKLIGISVKTDMGVVSLSGMVNSDEARTQAAKIVASLDGVKGVETTELKVKAG